MHGLEYSITVKIPAMSAVFLKPVNKHSPESNMPKAVKVEKTTAENADKDKKSAVKTDAAAKASAKAPAKKPTAKTAAKKANTANRKKNGTAKK